MKLLKQPLVWIGAVACLGAIVIAVVTTMFHPTSSAIDKFEKALNEKDAKLMAECISPNAQNKGAYAEMLSQMGAYLAMQGIVGEPEFEILVGNAESMEGTDMKNVPTILVIKVGDKVMYFSEDDEQLITVDGKEYLYSE